RGCWSPYGDGDGQAYFGAAAGDRAHVQVGADQQGAFAHPADARALGGVDDAAAVVADPQLDASGDAAQGDPGAPGTRVADHVGQPFLGDPVEDQFGLRAQLRQVRVEPVLHAQALPPELGGERLQGADQAQLVQHPGAQPPGDAPDLVQAAAGGLLHQAQLLPQVLGGVVGDPLQLQQHGGEALADLVVQLLGDAAAFALLRGQGAGAARGAFVLQPVQHRVVRADQFGDLPAPGDLGTAPGAEQVGGGHGTGEAVQRGEADPQQQGVGTEHGGQSDREHRGLGQQHRGGDG